MRKTGKVVLAISGICLFVGTAFVIAGKIGGAEENLVGKWKEGAGSWLHQYSDYDRVRSRNEKIEAVYDEVTIKEGTRVDDLEISLGARKVTIKTADVDEIQYEGLQNEDEAYIEDSTFYLTDHSSGLSGNKGETTILLPKKIYDEVNITIGAGSAEISDIEAEELSIEVGAGFVKAENLIARTETNLTVNAGKFLGRDLELYNAEVECGMGSVSIHGNIYEDNNFECGMGNLKLELKENRKSYHIEAEGGMSNIRVDGKKITGMFDDEYHDEYGGDKGILTLECGMGAIEVDFKN